ncbi:hypothetical protein [Leptolyngbya sp. FACHB-261]|uniref:hypothetical protein n=1 Tax=Leptolyngbya sp. FACHB-261 TaxID=2692806 RepID=UPI001687241C|nr:hypothetical protein [Leptolyngbya sp. FACHB-261]MBD2099313.1 hypothetical protein [Leptolyngbya sp. FACHB-261]
MATDYIVFVHGVNTREQREQSSYADDLFERIQDCLVQDSCQRGGLSVKVKSVPLYWGDVNKQAEDELLAKLRDPQGCCWDKLWFKEFRAKQLLQFAGDAALFISRKVGSKIVDELKQQALAHLEGYQPEDRLHLVTHSWGTVILFDILFAARWDQKGMPGYQSAQAIRQGMFGMGPNPEQGIRLASIHTMGSPIALFSLIDVVQGKDIERGQRELTQGESVQMSSHDITPQLQELLKNMHQMLGLKKLPWHNFIHPGDPVAYPLACLMSDLVDGKKRYLDIRDRVLRNSTLLDYLNQPVSQCFLSLLHGGSAHSSYWKNQEVAETIAQTIRDSAKQSLTALPCCSLPDGQGISPALVSGRRGV